MRVIRNIPSIFIICFWVMMMGLLVKKEFIPQSISAQKIGFPKGLPYVREWGIYKKSGRIGYLKTKLVLMPIGYIWKNIARIKLFEENSILIRGTSFFDKNERLRDFHIGLRYEDFNVNLKAVVKGEFLKIILKKDAGIEEYLLPWIENTDVVSNGMIPWFYFSGLKIGSKFKWYIINPLTRTRDLVKAVVKRETFYYNEHRPYAQEQGKENFVPVMIADIYYQDTKLEFWVDSKGNPLRVVTPWEWELEAE